MLKAIYQYNEQNQSIQSLDLKLSASDFLTIREFETNSLMKGLNALVRKGYVNHIEDKYYLTASGKKESKRIVRLHRLWEQYLLKRTSIDTDHVHSGAEAIEHILTPEIEAELTKELGIDGVPKEDY